MQREKRVEIAQKAATLRLIVLRGPTFSAMGGATVAVKSKPRNQASDRGLRGCDGLDRPQSIVPQKPRQPLTLAGLSHYRMLVSACATRSAA